MKFLIIQENGRHDKNRNFRECFCMQRALIKIGEECDIWGLGHSNYRKIPEYHKYDVIINFENCDGTGWIPDLSSVNKFKLYWAIDEHCRGADVFEAERRRSKYNIILHSTLDYVRKDGIWFPNCFDDTVIYTKDIQKRCDIGFCGNIVNRQQYLDFLKRNFNFISDIFVIGDDMVNAINSYRIHFNKNIANDINYRNFETIGCKIPLITNYDRQYDKLGFVDGGNCIFYRNLEELKEKILYFLNNTSQLNEIADNGYILSKVHTYESRARSLVKYILEKV